jgi:1-carboxybiuret hydrolase subunit AtzG-like protein
MTRKTVRKAKSRRAAKSTAKKPRGTNVSAAKSPAEKRDKTLKHDTIDAMIAASAQALGLTLDPAWQAGIKSNLQLVLRHAALIDEFPLPDDAEPAPVFHA